MRSRRSARWHILEARRRPELADALADILKLRDANLPDCESLIAGMLARRDQWLLLLPGIVLRRTAMGRAEGKARRALPPRTSAGV